MDAINELPDPATTAGRPSRLPAPYRSYREWWDADQKRKKENSEARAAEIRRVIEEERRREYEAKRREDERINSANYRARKRALAKSQSDAELPDLLEALEKLDEKIAPWPSPELIAAEVRQFADWFRTGGKRQSQLHKDRHHYMRSRIALLEARGEFGQDPTYPEFARLLSRRVGGEWTKETARTRLNALRRLEGADGPWEEVYP